MIYTITFNPSLDYLMYVNNFEDGETNRSFKEEIYPGGKGFNVSTILWRLNLPTTALGFIAGFTGQEIQKQLLKRGFNCDLCILDNGMSRINVKLKSQVETEINGSGPDIPKDKITELFKKLEKLENGDILILAGSIPSSMPNDTYEQIMKLLKNKDVAFVVDATNDLLKKVLPYHPFLIKPNQRELEELYQVTINSREDIIKYAKKLQEQGAINVLVSLGKDGAMLLTEKREILSLNAPKINAVDTCGAGDSMIAGFLYGAATSPEYALRFAVACGSATASVTGIAGKQTVLNTLRIM